VKERDSRSSRSSSSWRSEIWVKDGRTSSDLRLPPSSLEWCALGIGSWKLGVDQGLHSERKPHPARIRHNVTVRSARGFTLIELLVVMAIVALLATMAMVGYRHARVRSQEAAAITALNAINHAQFAFMQSCGKQRYAPTLVSLAQPAPGAEHGFISPDLAMSDPLQKSGYVLTLSGTPSTEGDQTCNGAVPLERYKLTADPLDQADDSSYFGTNTDRVIYADRTTFAEDMPETGAPGHGTEIR
jgi:prepilin-type N-terminal cleavage/methylation domain-containing protein